MAKGNRPGGSGGGGTKTSNSVQPFEQSALDRRAEKNAEYDLNDDYTMAMDALYDGFYLNGTPATGAELMVNSIVGSGLITDPSGTVFNTNVAAQAAAQGISKRNVPQALSDAADAFTTAQTNAMNAGSYAESEFYKDMAVFAKMIGRKYQ